MKIYDVINELEKLIKENNDKVSLVLHRSMQEHPVIKVMKRFNYNLYMIEGKEKTRLLEVQLVDKCPTDQIEEVWDKQDILFVFNLLKWMDTESYKKLRDGVQSMSD